MLCRTEVIQLIDDPIILYAFREVLYETEQILKIYIVYKQKS